MKDKASNKVMSKIMNLLARAEHPETPPAEADLCRQKADSLMAQHMIDRMDLTVEEKSKVEMDVWDLRVGDGSDRGEFAANMTDLMTEVLTHCGVRVNRKFTYLKDEAGNTDYKVRQFKVVGFPEDMGYAERIWFRVFKEFVSNLAPTWEKSLSIRENAYALINSGVEWQQIVLMANKVGDDRMPVSEMEPDPKSWSGKLIPVKGNRPLVRGIQMLRKEYRLACEERGEEATYRRGAKLRQASRSSFARSFTSTIRQRLRTLRETTKQTVSDGDKFALAIRTTAEQVDEEFYRLFPEFDPEVQRRKWAEQDFLLACQWAALSDEEQARILKEQAAEQARWERRAARARNSYRTVREAPDRTDHAAWERGRRSANNVNLRDDGEVKDQNRKGLK